MRVLVTGAAGFIGYHLCERLLALGDEVLGADNVNDYYDVRLKEARLERLRRHVRFDFRRVDLGERKATAALFSGARFDAVVHLAAQAGVRYSLEDPLAYTHSNLSGFSHVLEGCRHAKPDHLVFASSSSVYGARQRVPFCEHDPVDHPLSFYAATKRANELMAHAYAHAWGLPATGLRFFTVYGPWGRPDMAYFSFTRKILADEPVPLFGGGDAERDFTYIDDAVEALVRLIGSPPQPAPRDEPASPALSSAPFRIYNIGNRRPVRVRDFLALLERLLGRRARIELRPLPPADVLRTCADTAGLERAIGYRPRTPLEEGLARFVAWYREYYGG